MDGKKIQGYGTLARCGVGKRQAVKIDRLYDVLKAANAKKRSPENTGNDDENDSK